MNFVPCVSLNKSIFFLLFLFLTINRCFCRQDLFHQYHIRSSDALSSSSLAWTLLDANFFILFTLFFCSGFLFSFKRRCIRKTFSLQNKCFFFFSPLFISSFLLPINLSLSRHCGCLRVAANWK